MPASPKNYDVFISFRGEDTRTTFTSHLHRALRLANIETYIDDNLRKGDEVWPALAAAIQDSSMSIVVFSEDYATSKWCLDELVEILKRRNHHGQVVIPVFYNIDPSHVRKQNGSFEKAFAKYERELRNNKSHEDKVSGWRAALTVAANISGWDSRTYRDDSQVIDYIVKDIWQKLSLMYPNELKNIVQIDEKSNYIESLPKLSPRIGIWGMGGIGKTTIAKQMFVKHFAQYDSVCFLEKVNEDSEKFGLPHLRDKLLGELLKRPVTTSDALGLHTFIKRRFNARKVFVVLDDVGNATQLEYLCEELDDLGPNSRLIITTRDKHMLEGRVNEIYEVRKWKFDESLKLFSLGAFKQSHPKEGFEGLSKRAVAYAGDIPLALKVLGSHLHSRNNTEFWQDELNYLEKNGECLDEIQKVLKVSYNGLRVQEKEIFLDVAFFFKDDDEDFVTSILYAFGFNATSGMEILKDKALITISNRKRIQMHDLLQKMAFDIVREESRDPGRRSRLRDAKEVHDLLKSNKGNDVVEGIIFDLSQKVDLHVREDTFNIMTKLRFLRFYIPLGKKRSATVYHPQEIKPFFDKLAYLEWDGYPLKSLPQPFCAQKLVNIRLPNSDIEHLWDGTQELVNLEKIDLRECKKLIELPDLSEASKLKRLYLSGCESLCEVKPSVFYKDALVELLVDGCKKLPRLKSEKHLTFLAKINVSGCTSLREFSLSSDSITELDLRTTGVEILHSSIGRLGKLWTLNLDGLMLQNLPQELSCLGSLRSLSLSNCNIVTKSTLEAIFDDGLKSLKRLYLKDCCNLFELPTNISSLSSLEDLSLDGSSVKMLPKSIKDLSSLEFQNLDNCSMLCCLPELSPHLKVFHADNCTSLVMVSTLKTFSKFMKGKYKCISFKNDKELDGPSLDRIAEDAILTMKSAAFQNILVRKYRFQTHSFNYSSGEVCLPGSTIPRQFKYRTTDSSSITIDISRCLGFIFSVVVSPSHGMKNRNSAIVKCRRCSGGGRLVTYEPSSKAISNLNMDHVFVWYDPYYSDGILSDLRNDKRMFSFEFCVTTTHGRESDGFFSLKGCGICPIYYNEFPTLLGTMNLEKDLELELRDEVIFESKANESDDEVESTGISTQIQNQELSLNEEYHCSDDCLIASQGTQVYDDSREREIQNDGDNDKLPKKRNILKGNSSTIKRVNSVGGSEEAESSTEGPDKVVGQGKMKAQHPKQSTEESENSQKSPSSMKNKAPDAIEIPCNFDTTNLHAEEVPDKLNPKTLIGASTCSFIPPKKLLEAKQEKVKEAVAEVSSTTKLIPLNFSELNRIREEDPLALVEKILSGELRQSMKIPQSTIETAELQSGSIEMLLDDLRQLAFSRNLLKHLPNDMALREEVEALLSKLNGRDDELSEKQKLGLAEFNRIFREAAINIDEGQVSTDTLQQLEVDYEASKTKLQASKDEIGKLDESITTGQSKIKDVDIQIEEIRAQIRQLEEQAHKLQQEKSLLEDTCSKCQEKRVEIKKEVQSESSETLQNIGKIAHLEKKKQESDLKYRRLKGLYVIMRSAPPF